MSEYSRCAVCKEFDVTSRHRCKPSWKCGSEPDELYKTVFAADAATAAEEFACYRDQSDCDCNEQNSQVFVETPEGVKRFSIRMEMTPLYYAKEIPMEVKHG